MDQSVLFGIWNSSYAKSALQLIFDLERFKRPVSDERIRLMIRSSMPLPTPKELAGFEQFCIDANASDDRSRLLRKAGMSVVDMIWRIDSKSVEVHAVDTAFFLHEGMACCGPTCIIDMCMLLCDVRFDLRDNLTTEKRKADMSTSMAFLLSMSAHRRHMCRITEESDAHSSCPLFMWSNDVFISRMEQSVTQPDEVREDYAMLQSVLFRIAFDSICLDSDLDSSSP